MYGNPVDSSSNDVYFSIEKDNHGVERILATGHQQSANKRVMIHHPDEQFTNVSCKRRRLHDTDTYLKVL